MRFVYFISIAGDIYSLQSYLGTSNILRKSVTESECTLYMRMMFQKTIIIYRGVLT